jgi:hypothetical protein
MSRLIGHPKSISFRFRWILMSPQERYYHLWSNTKKLGNWGYIVRNPAIVVSK